ncbi:MAG: pseudouridine synthase [Anaerovoracaceae bacterium]|nr:pseudouridine synthase [Anaerovoracaceae bacterium]
MRLNKYIAHSGVTSRRKADLLMEAGNVKVNGVVIRTPGYDVQEGDIVEVNGRVVSPQEKAVYIMMNKPAGCVTTVSDDRGRTTVMDLITDIPERIYPVGRLDYNTTGLLILTNDGELANRLMHPSAEIPKTYRALVTGTLTQEKLRKLRRGVDIGGFVTSPARVDVIRRHPHYYETEITIHEGKNRQVRRMFEAVGCKVRELKRISVGELYISRLAEGHYRRLRRDEIEYLRSL